MDRRVAALLVGLVAFLCTCENPIKAKIDLSVEGITDIKEEEATYVCCLNGKADNPGSRSYPLANIEAAVSRLEALGMSGEVRVAAGSYRIDRPIYVRDGISIIGGYSNTTWEHAPGSFISEIVGESVESVFVVENVRGGTTIEGFTIGAEAIANNAIFSISRSSVVIRDNIITGISAGLESHCIVNVDSSPHIRGNAILAGTGTHTIAISNISSTPIIEENFIAGGAGTEFSFGILNSNSSPVIRNNVIYAGNAGSPDAETHGVASTGSSAPLIQNNTIFAGTGNIAVAIYIGNSGCVVENNILFGNDTTGQPEFTYGLFESNPEYPAVMLNNNAFYHCEALYVYWDGSSWKGFLEAGLTAMESRIIAKGYLAESNQVIASPGFVDEENLDLRLSSASPPELTLGGKDLSYLFTRDIAGTSRTLPWSIGAFEQD